MPAPDLRNIRSFDQLVRYLEDELGWPLEGYDFEDLVFDYEPEELGLRAEDAAKVKTIRQLRPLDAKQPWGIFFIEFDRKKLPVVVLRRILSHLVVKKRASANKAHRAAWDAEDLLFISAFGPEDESREITFAHFHQESGDMPTLRVLGWDGGDTPLALAHIDQTLRQRLQWTDSGESFEAWHTRWAGAFRHRLGHVIKTADQLAEALAGLAKRIRDAATTLIQRETSAGPLRKLHTAFKDHLIHDLTEESFADTYAQTITYGLLTAAISRTEMSEGRHGTALVAGNVADMVPITNPFLKEMLQTFLHAGGRKGGIDFDELGVQDVVDLLRGDETDLPAILRDFGNKKPGEDPVIHFYEHFLNAYNKALKIQRGVFYTPQPVVSYIVRSVHKLLQTDFGLEHGLADTTTWGEMIKKHPELKLPTTFDDKNKEQPIPEDEFFVQILDPATGTATFPVEVIEVIYNHLKDLWQKRGLAAMPTIPNSKSSIQNWSEYWNEYVPKALLPRLHAFELMMAPYAIAHMKVGLKLAETGYQFRSNERARIYLTNALEPWVKQLPLIGFDALAHEAAAVNNIKRHKRFTVVIGNPPYSNFGQLNKIPFLLELLDDYKRGLNERKINLDDDFIKFVRMSQHLLDNTGVGVLGMITNNVFFDGITHRRMREFLASSFGRIVVVDLHGSAKKVEASPDGATDENVFDIQQGVGISIFAKRLQPSAGGFLHADLFGDRESKYRRLASADASVTFSQLQPPPPNYFFVPKNFSNQAEYESGWRTKDIFLTNGDGIETKRDNLTIQFSPRTVEEAISDTKSLSDGALRVKYQLPDDGRDWQVAAAKQDLLKSKGRVVPIAYRPFDIRFTYFSGKSRGFIAYPRAELSGQLLAPQNLGLVVNRFVKLDYFAHVFVINSIADKHLLETANSCVSLNPLYSTPETDGHLQFSKVRATNFTPAFLIELASSLGLPRKGADTLPASLTPEDIFYYAYAVFHSPGYRSRYAEFLKIDFPRLPLTSSLDLFRVLARLGGELVALHLLESPALENPRTQFVGPSREVVKAGWVDGTVWIDAGGKKSETRPGTSGFRGVPEAVWNFHIGGYQVCEKWLKDRKGRTLTDDDIAHYHKIVISLGETIRIMSEIDEVINQHGGWPGAFQTAQP
jgi:hypothetical protein